MIKKTKQLLLSLLAGTLLFTYVSELAPVSLQARTSHEQDIALIERMAETIIQDADGHYVVDMAKVKEYNLEDKLDKLEYIVEDANINRLGDDNTIDKFLIFGLTVAEVVKALILAGIAWLAKQLLNLGLYLVCQWQGYNMYLHSIAGRYNPGSYLFYSLCKSNRMV